MTRIYVLYFSENPGEGRQEVMLSNNLKGYVRVAYAGPDVELVQALDEADPDDDETVLNSVMVEGS